MPPRVINVITKYGPRPTTIQSYVWPELVLARSDLVVDGIALAKSGSGRRLAYLVPALISTMTAEVGGLC